MQRGAQNLASLQVWWFECISSWKEIVIWEKKRNGPRHFLLCIAKLGSVTIGPNQFIWYTYWTKANVENAIWRTWGKTWYGCTEAVLVSTYAWHFDRYSFFFQCTHTREWYLIKSAHHRTGGKLICSIFISPYMFSRCYYRVQTHTWGEKLEQTSIHIWLGKCWHGRKPVYKY